MFIHSPRSSFEVPLLAVTAAFAIWVSNAAASPDRVIFKNGRVLDGMIVRSDASSITLRRGGGEQTFLRNAIRRVDDTATTGAYFAASDQALPPWNAIVNDLRSNEGVLRLRLVTATREKTGIFAGIPCLVFEMNGSVELRIYGDPQNPTALQLGLRGGKAGDASQRAALRAFFAGFLTQRSQIAALYSLSLEGGERIAGGLRIAYGKQRADNSRAQWWLAAWKPATLGAARDGGTAAQLEVAHGWERGFQRDPDGRIRPLPADRASALDS